MPDVKLYGYATSPYVRKVGAFLYYKQVPFTHVPVNPVDPAATIGHTNGTMVPVLEIDGEYRRESSNLAFWLDEHFTDQQLCPAEDADTIRLIDEWVSDTFLRSIFRPAIDAPLTLDFRYRFWRLAALVSAHTPLPEQIRHLWPDFVKAAPFIKAMGETMDLSEPIPDMQQRIVSELAQHIGDGPFLGGLKAPSMLDLAVFPNLVFGYMFGLEEELSAARHPLIRPWMQRVAAYLPENPTLVADEMQIHSISEGLA